MTWPTVAHVGLLLRCSELRAGELLSSAELLVRLAGAVEALDCGLLTVEQSRTVVSALCPLPPEVAVGVWERLRARLVADEDAGVVLPPARLRSLLARWVIQADADAAARRRRQAQQDGEVSYRRREDGLVDLFAGGLSVRMRWRAWPGSGRARLRWVWVIRVRRDDVAWMRWST